MRDARPTILAGELINDDTQLSTEEILRVCSIGRESLQILVNEGVLRPSGDTPEDWRFEGSAIVHTRKAVRLADELEIELPAVAIVMELLQQIESLRRQLAAAKS